MAKATWLRVLDEMRELEQNQAQNPPPLGAETAADKYRRSKITKVEGITKRPLMVYATACTTPGKNVSAELIMLDFSDKIAFKTVTDNIPAPNLDILIHSPGGYADAAETLVQQLRAKYTNIRFIVPSFAKSAATMLVMSGNEILMDQDAELGPIDPQMRTPNGTSPAEAILEQFKKAQAELQADATKLPSWMPILAPLGPSLIVDCEHAIDLAKTLVESWTMTYMLAGDAEAKTKSSQISKYLGKHTQFKSHGRPIKIPDLIPIGVKAKNIRDDPDLYKAIDELYCCLDILLTNSPVYKIVENGAGDALIRQSGMFQGPIIQMQAHPGLPPGFPPQMPPVKRV
jgi:hypothetical protein